MKHIIYILLFISLGATAQIKVGVNFDKNNHADNSYNVKSDNVKGGWHSVATIIQRDSLLAQFSTTLQDGMAVFVRADSTGYIRNQVAGVWNKFTGYSKAKQDSLLALKLNKTDTASLSTRINKKANKNHLDSLTNGTASFSGISVNGNSGTVLTKTTGGGSGSALTANTYAPSNAVASILDLKATGVTGGDFNQYTFIGVTPPTGAGNSYFTYGLPSTSGNLVVLDGSGKVPLANLPANLLVYKGQWNPSTNVPTLADGTGVAGSTYEASTAGTINLGSGSILFAQGDFVIYNGTAWQISAGTDRVTSVNGQQGIVALNTDNVGEGSTNKYYTNSRTIGSTLTGYVSGAGTISATDNILQAIQKLNGNNATNANLTGDVTSVGNATTITNSSVTNAKILNSTIDLTAKVTGLLPDANISSAATWNAKPVIVAVATYAAMITAAVGGSNLMLKVLNDEDKTKTNTLYIYFAVDGSILYVNSSKIN